MVIRGDCEDCRLRDELAGFLDGAIRELAAAARTVKQNSQCTDFDAATEAAVSNAQRWRLAVNHARGLVRAIAYGPAPAPTCALCAASRSSDATLLLAGLDLSPMASEGPTLLSLVIQEMRRVRRKKQNGTALDQVADRHARVVDESAELPADPHLLANTEGESDDFEGPARPKPADQVSEVGRVLREILTPMERAVLQTPVGEEAASPGERQAKRVARAKHAALLHYAKSRMGGADHHEAATILRDEWAATPLCSRVCGPKAVRLYEMAYNQLSQPTAGIGWRPVAQTG